MLTVLRENQLCKTSTRHQKNSKQSRIVVLASCFAIIVAHQYGVTNREALLKNNPRTLYFNFWTKFPLRDGSLEKLREKWGIFEPDELFSVNIYLAWFFLGNRMNAFRVNLRAWIFFHLILPYANILFCTVEPHLTNTRFLITSLLRPHSFDPSVKNHWVIL